MKTLSYDFARGRIKTGDFYFSSSRSLVSRTISFFTRSKISHVGVFFWEGGRLMVAESIMGKGVRDIPFTNLKQVGVKRYWGRHDSFFTSEEIVKRIFSKSSNIPEIGSQYDLTGCLFAIFRTSRSKEAYCAEYAQKLLNLSFPAKTNGILPSDLANLCSEKLFQIK